MIRPVLGPRATGEDGPSFLRATRPETSWEGPREPPLKRHSRCAASVKVKERRSMSAVTLKNFRDIPPIGQLDEMSCWAACLAWWLRAVGGNRPQLDPGDII